MPPTLECWKDCSFSTSDHLLALIGTFSRRDLVRIPRHLREVAYADTFERKLHTEQFGIKNFRVLAVTTGRERVRNMQDAFQAEVGSSAPAGLFLFAEKGRTPEAMLDWLNGNGDPVSLN